MREPVHFIPVLTTVIAVAFAAALWRRWRWKGGDHLLAWSIGVALYGVGTFTEAYVTLFGWNPTVFRAWYISGALLGGAPLAQGTVYLMFTRSTANRLTVALLAYVAVAAACVIMAPIDWSLVEPHRLTGRVMTWGWVRAFSPFINLYAVIFLIGGAIVSAMRYRRSTETYHRFVGNVLIAIGAILPGIGGTATRMGHTEVLYVTELLGICLIWLGYRSNIKPARLAGGTDASPPLREPAQA